MEEAGFAAGISGDIVWFPKTAGKKRGSKYGLSAKELEKYDVGLGDVIMHGIDAMFYEPDAPQIADELMQIKSAVEDTANLALEKIPFDSPKRDRYYGANDDERLTKAMEMVEAKLGKPVTPRRGRGIYQAG